MELLPGSFMLFNSLFITYVKSSYISPYHRAYHYEPETLLQKGLLCLRIRP